LTTALNAKTFSAAAAREPDRIYLNLENIKSPSDAALFYVYVNLPQGADPEKIPDHFAGTLSMFGVSKASTPLGPTGGDGVTGRACTADIAVTDNSPLSEFRCASCRR